jgi:hypothetical protein
VDLATVGRAKELRLQPVERVLEGDHLVVGGCFRPHDRSLPVQRDLHADRFLRLPLGVGAGDHYLGSDDALFELLQVVQLLADMVPERIGELATT